MKVLTPIFLLKQTIRSSQRGGRATALSCARPFSAAPTAESIMALSKEHWLDAGVYKNHVKGAFVTVSSPNTYHSVFNPATNELVGKVPETSDAEFDDIMATAQKAYEDWRNVPVQQRQRVMLEYQRLIRENTNELAGLITLENGKTIADAKGDVFRGLEVVETACQVAPLLLGDSLAGIGSTIDCISFREPLGVCAGIGTYIQHLGLFATILL
jgi:malonate-semialdehyde dehydrogenase (acetylating) / methylmalonate-semialdehyde dehydrogenase